MERELDEMKQHEKLLLDKVMIHETQLARIEEHQEHTDELIRGNQEILNKNLENMRESIVNNLHTSVDARMSDMNTVIDGQQKTLNKIIEVQGKQSQQIEGIQKTLEQFTKIEIRVNDHESRIHTLEHQYQSEDELRRALKKERIKGIWALLGTAVAAIGSVAAAIIAALMR